MKDKEKAIEEEKKETKPEENSVKLTDEQLEQVTGGAKAPDIMGGAKAPDIMGGAKALDSSIAVAERDLIFDLS